MLDKKEEKFFDYFTNRDDFTSQKDLVKQSTRKNKILYLHGSWFIQANDEDELRKLSFGTKGEDTINSLFANGCRPHLILEDRWQTKKNFLTGAENPYFNHCYEQLKNIKGDLLIFGCSFNNDDHIIQALAKTEKPNNIYVTYINDKAKEEIESNILKALSTEIVNNKVEFIKIKDDEIWEKRKSHSL
jgi:hypothetical protein